MKFSGLLTEIIDFLNNATAGISELIGMTIKELMTQPMEMMLNSTSLTSLYDVFVPVSILLCLLYMSMDLLSKATMSNFNLDVLIKNFIRLIIGITLINNGVEIIKGLNGLSVWIVDMFWQSQETLFVISTDFDTVPVPSESYTFFEMIIAFVNFLKSIIDGSLLSMILYFILINICVVFVSYQRTVKIGYYTIVAPLVMADVSGHGLQIKSKKYLKGLFASFMEYPMVMIAVGAALKLFNDPRIKPGLANEAPYLLSYVIVLTPIVLIGIVFKGKKFAKEIFN